MAIYVFKMKTFSRNAGSRGSRATSAAAYRAGERIRDVRTGASYDHRRRHDVLHKEIVLPRELAARGREMDWARSRATLWNAAERAETRANARVAREFTLALPHELGQTERVRLAQGFASDLAERYGTAVDLVIHAPRGDARNYHAHLLSTTRELTADGLGPKAALELSGTERHRRGLTSWAAERAWLREHWAEASNQALREAGLDVRVSHVRPRSPDLTRPPWLPSIAYHIEQTGRRSFVAERIRAQHRAQLEQAQLERVQLQQARGQQARSQPAQGQKTLQSPQVPAGPASTAEHWLERARTRAQSVWRTLRDRLGIADAFDQSHRLPPAQGAAIREPERLAEHPGHGEAPLAPGERVASGGDLASAYSQAHDQEMASPEEARLTAIRNWLDYRQQGPEHTAEKAEPEPQIPGERGNDYDLSL